MCSTKYYRLNVDTLRMIKMWPAVTQKYVLQ
jgi:hypothetical protein